MAANSCQASRGAQCWVSPGGGLQPVLPRGGTTWEHVTANSTHPQGGSEKIGASMQAPVAGGALQQSGGGRRRPRCRRPRLLPFQALVLAAFPLTCAGARTG